MQFNNPKIRKQTLVCHSKSQSCNVKSKVCQIRDVKEKALGASPTAHSDRRHVLCLNSKKKRKKRREREDMKEAKTTEII